MRLSSPALPAVLFAFACAIGLSVSLLAPPATLPRAQFRHAQVHILRNPDATPARGRRNQMLTGNWSGFVVARYLTGQSYTSAQMIWIVPAVGYGASNDSARSTEFSAEWVGIGGYCENSLCTSEDETLIQLGTAAAVSPAGRTQYFAWFERLPEFERAIPLKIEPGDLVTATLSCGDSCRRREQIWTLTMRDGARSWRKHLAYRSRQLSVEWIEEAPTGRSILPLADFGTAEFDATSGADGQMPSLSVSENGLEMRNPWGQTADLSAATALAQFATCWGFETFTTCPAP